MFATCIIGKKCNRTWLAFKATRGVRGASSRRVMSDKVFHTSSTAARGHTGAAACRPSDVHNSATCDALSDVIDRYAACYNNNNRPQAFAIGQNATGQGRCSINRAHHRN